MRLTRPVVRYQGGKYRIAPWVISHFPSHKIYLEPFGGAASVLMHKWRSPVEVYNDLDERVYAVFKVLQDREKAKELEYRLRYTPYSREAWKEAYRDQYCEDEIETAAKTIIRAFMSNAANGATCTRSLGFGLKIYTEDRRCPNAAAWVTYPDYIKYFCNRLQGVVLENKDAIELIKYLDKPETLHYVDPPYVNSTWSATDKYKHSIDEEYHKSLLAVLKEAKGMVVLSGYDNELYGQELANWKMVTKETINQHNQKRIECLWINPNAQAAKQCLLIDFNRGGGWTQQLMDVWT